MAFPFDLLVRSLCPSIIGHNMVKAGILLGLLGGTPQSSSGLEDVRSGISIRSNIHCLIVGDPGMGKSCLLLATTQVAARSVYVGGNTSTTTGLTVSLSKEAGGEVGIEAGALVLADQGVCCIDEFDKMTKSNQDGEFSRHATQYIIYTFMVVYHAFTFTFILLRATVNAGLLEAMEQQQISIAKAGVVASLPARCCVIAAANPRQGKYNMNKSVAENLNVPPPLLSRFDLVFILRDEVDTDQDKLVSRNIMNIYRQQKTDQMDQGGHNKQQVLSDQMTMKARLAWVAETQTPLPSDLVKDYISYAREYCMPKLTPDAAAVLKDYFMTLRYPGTGVKRNDSIPITTRQLEALIRLAQARAKACLREFVLKEDAEDVVELMRDSVNQVHMDGSGRLDRTRGGVGGKSKRKQKQEFMDALRRCGQNGFSKDDFYRVSSQLDLPLNDFWSLVDELRYCDQPELRKGQDGMYYLL
jgi:DNA helicase MCM8